MSGTLSLTYVNTFKQEFERKCQTLVIQAYESAISYKFKACDFDEEDITAHLCEFIDDNPMRIKWNIISNTEDRLKSTIATKTKGYAKKLARIDLRFTTISSELEYRYFMEAKNLKENDSTLNRRYIETGIDNYNSGKYNDGFLAGYVISGSVASSINGINNLLVKDKRDKEIISPNGMVLHGLDLYVSKHPNINLIHVFFDFTSV